MAIAALGLWLRSHGVTDDIYQAASQPAYMAGPVPADTLPILRTDLMEPGQIAGDDGYFCGPCTGERGTCSCPSHCGSEICHPLDGSGTWTFAMLMDDIRKEKEAEAPVPPPPPLVREPAFAGGGHSGIWERPAQFMRPPGPERRSSPAGMPGWRLERGAWKPPLVLEGLPEDDWLKSLMLEAELMRPALPAPPPPPARPARKPAARRRAPQQRRGRTS